VENVLKELAVKNRAQRNATAFRELGLPSDPMQ